MAAFDEKTELGGATTESGAFDGLHPRAQFDIGSDSLPLKNGAVRAMLDAMEKLSPTVKFVAAIVLATAAFGGLFWLLFGQGAT